MRATFIWACVVFKLEEATMPDLRGHTIYDPVCTKYSEKANPETRVQADVVSRGCGKRECEREATDGFEVSSQGYRDI